MQSLRPGTVVAVAVGPINHVGIVTERFVGGFPTIISNSQKVGRVAEETLQEFANGGAVRVHGYMGKLVPSIVLQRARSQLGRVWKLFGWNCEHFVFWAHGLKPTSPQLVAGVAIVLVSAVMAALVSRR